MTLRLSDIDDYCNMASVRVIRNMLKDFHCRASVRKTLTKLMQEAL